MSSTKQAQEKLRRKAGNDCIAFGSESKRRRKGLECNGDRFAGQVNLQQSFASKHA
jgi:hypothetical protein